MTIKIAFLNFVIAFLKEYLYRKHICISSTELNYYIYAYGILPEMFELDYNGKWYYMPSIRLNPNLNPRLKFTIGIGSP